MHKFSMKGLDGNSVEFSIPLDADLTEMLEQFTLYLKAIGYPVPEGEVLDFSPENGYSDKGWDKILEDSVSETKPKSLWDATPQEWNQASYNLKVKYEGISE